MNYECVVIEKSGRVATLTVSREASMNALNAQVLTELREAVLELEADTDIRAVVVTGAGKAFVAGADIAEMSFMGTKVAQMFAELGAELGRAMEHSSMAFIAAVNGFALGGGCELAMCCDFIYASEKAKFGQPEVKLGVIPGFGGTQRMSRRVGAARTRELCMTGRMVDASEALAIGLCERVCSPETLVADAMKSAILISEQGPLAVAEVKRVVREGLAMELGDACKLEQEAFAGLFATEDQREGMEAFMQKRDANFCGR